MIQTDQIKELLAEGNNMELFDDVAEVFCDSGILTDMLTDAERQRCYDEFDDINDGFWDWDDAVQLHGGTTDALTLINKLRYLTGIDDVEGMCRVVSGLM